MLDNSNIINKIKEDVYTENNILEELETLNNLDYKSEEYQKLYNKVIQVGEYPIENKK